MFCVIGSILSCVISGKRFYLTECRFFYYFFHMAKITYNTRMEEELMKKFKILAIQLGKRQNQLLEEAIKDILKKYEKKGKK